MWTSCTQNISALSLSLFQHILELTPQMNTLCTVTGGYLLPRRITSLFFVLHKTALEMGLVVIYPG